MEASYNRKHAWLGLTALFLLVCVMASLAILVSRVVGYTKAEYYNTVALDDPIIQRELEIFRLTYDNASGETTVKGVEGSADKLIAPGTTNLFEFTLHNPLDYSIDYIMTMEARVEGTELRLPVKARVWDYTNRYLLGSPDEMPDVLELNTVEDTGELGPDRYAPYTIEWEWPFEWGDDEYDTMLGNLAVDRDLTLTVVVRVLAEYDEEPDNPDAGEHPKTGDDSQLALFALMGGVSLTGFVVVLLPLFKSRRKKLAEGDERHES